MYELPHSIKQITHLSNSIKQENQLTVTYHWASYRHVTPNNTGKLQIFYNLLSRNINELSNSIKPEYLQTTKLH
jgi:Rps23 Pro-64 3,4-dihydroxylase Tpa1-like proline 4-hydroxylase